MLVLIVRYIIVVLATLFFLIFPYGFMVAVELDGKTDKTVSTSTKVFGALGFLVNLWLLVKILIPTFF